MLELGVKFLISYFLGSVMGAMVMGRLKGGVDIREMGSGNAGGTNALRTQGKGFALGVVIVDIGKGALAAGVVPMLSLSVFTEPSVVSVQTMALICAAAAVMGHVWPVYHRFRGGKGAATYIGGLLVVAPQLVPLMLLVFAVSLVLSGFVGLSTMLAASSLPAWSAVLDIKDQNFIVFGVLMALFIIYCHRSNISRMRAGNENRNERVMLFARKS